MIKEIIKNWCVKAGIVYQELTPYQLRLTKHIGNKDILLDVYPVNQRFHIIRHIETEMVQQRGGFENINELLESIFNYGHTRK